METLDLGDEVLSRINSQEDLEKEVNKIEV